ncbi:MULTISPECIES: TetR/AcrR family transcriptional regulator [Mesobacillus]|uniref:TetR/AcrR family transcriptional regulator n=1 Tax=Mesobacillus TaxID=2675231 RepID=UPI00177DE3F3|nr:MULTISPECIES: TetR/AcrR family transcriptional regulator [Mesobacillus]MCM3573493.1 TetR/AcrR family transcriptional regulator [Mesobacillus subterraneus]UYZ22969.1 TetR/AcrR family transcriptional regulator [Mesobacillus jeotgali]
MKEKEKAIIEAAIKLYATKGFASTSIQEIVSESGISKGAFYLYFKSKDALLIAILEYYFDYIQTKLEAYEQEQLPPREKFSLQLAALFNTMLEHKEFIIMQSREQAIPLNEEVKELMIRKYYEAQMYYQSSLRAIYGQKAEPHLWDLALMLEGFFNSYMKLLIFNPEGFKINELVEYILRRVDSLVDGLEGEEPVASEEKVQELINKTKAFFLADTQDIKTILKKMKHAISNLEDTEDLNVSLEVLESEVERESPRIPVIQGMLSNFKAEQSLDSFREAIAEFYGVKG